MTIKKDNPSHGISVSPAGYVAPDSRRAQVTAGAAAEKKAKKDPEFQAMMAGITDQADKSLQDLKLWFLIEQQLAETTEKREAMDDILFHLLPETELLKKGELTTDELARADTRDNKVVGMSAVKFVNSEGQERYLVGDRASQYLLVNPQHIGRLTNLGNAQRDLFASQFKDAHINIDLTGPTLIDPRLADAIKRNPQIASYVEFTFQAAKKNGLDPVMLANQFWQESKFNPNAVSKAGARGISQIMPMHLGKFGLNSKDDFFDGEKSIAAGAQMMAQLSHKYGDQRLALVAYNGGGGAVDFVKNSIGKASITFGEWYGFMSDRREKLGAGQSGAWHVETLNYTKIIAGHPAPQPS